ncbi:MAG: Mg(2+) transporter [Thelocarpon superellum]|nr:MAG: Mg(2+) transporter [Thelocarpon superellum]
MDASMSEKSEKSETRFSTPVSDLDDHRHQPSSLPRSDTIGPVRRSMSISQGVTHPPHGGGPSTSHHPGEELRRTGPHIQDWEHAITEDDHEKAKARQGPEVDGIMGLPLSASPVTRRRGTLLFDQHPGKPIRSRASSASSDSSSPPNSVDAFADPRRRERAGTLDSKVPSDLDVPVVRAGSKATSSRRPTFSDGNVNKAEMLDEEVSKHDLAQEDVCFPPFGELSKTNTIDFEALEEFVAEHARRPGSAHCTHRTHSISSRSQRPRVFHDLRPKTSLSPLPIQVARDVPNTPQIRVESSDESDMLAEKHNELIRSTSASRPSPSEPNRFSFFSSDLDSTIHAPELGDLVLPGDSFRDLFELNPEGGVWWLDVLNATEEEIMVLTKAFSIHPLTSEDIKTQETREKVELFKQYYFVCFRSFYQMDKNSDDYMEPVNVYGVVFREGVLSFTFRHSPHAANVRQRIGKLRDYVSLSSDWICYAMIDDIVDSFGPVIKDIERETDVIEDQVFVARADDVGSLLRQIGQCRKKVNSLMRLLGGKADVIKGFAKRCNEQYSITPRGEIGLYLGDIQDHVVTMMSNLGHFEKMLSRSHSNHLAQLSVDSIEQGNHANRVLSKITIIATILVPLNLICGLFGMNVPVPGRETTDLSWFFGIIGVIGAIVVFSLLAAKRFRFI